MAWWAWLGAGLVGGIFLAGAIVWLIFWAMMKADEIELQKMIMRNRLAERERREPRVRIATVDTRFVELVHEKWKEHQAEKGQGTCADRRPAPSAAGG